MPVPLLDLAPQHRQLLPQMREAFERIIASGKFVVPNQEIETFEKSLASFCGCRFAQTISSGTDALLAALMALDIKPGDEVITTPFTFFATAGCISRLGAKPVFVDIDPITFNLDTTLIKQAITPRTKAIIPVHLFGLMADMDPIIQIARKHGLKIIEDAAQAIGARDHDRPAGSVGDIGCLSFYPTKNLAALGDGGACLCQDAQLDQRLKAIRLHGQTGEYQHDLIGGNFRLDTLQVAFLAIKLPLLNDWTAARRERADRYHHLLDGLPVVRPTAGPTKFHVYNQYTLRLSASGSHSRDALKKHLQQAGIGCKVYYPLPLHLQPCFAYLGYKAGSLPQAEKAAQEVLSLPIFPDLAASQQEQVAQSIREFFHGA